MSQDDRGRQDGSRRPDSQVLDIVFDLIETTEILNINTNSFGVWVNTTSALSATTQVWS